MMTPEAARRIKAIYPDAQIIIVVRAQPEMIAASYVQYVRGGGTHGPARYLHAGLRLRGAFRHPYKAPHFAFEHFEYDRLVAYYDTLFGERNVLVMPYEALRIDAGAFLARLNDQTGLIVDFPRIRRIAANRSFGLATLLIGRLSGLFTRRSVVDKTCLISIPGFYELRRLLLNMLSRVDRRASPEAILGRRTVAHIRSRYAASNRRLAQRMEPGLAALGYPMDSAAPPVDDAAPGSVTIATDKVVISLADASRKRASG